MCTSHGISGYMYSGDYAGDTFLVGLRMILRRSFYQVQIAPQPLEGAYGLLMFYCKACLQYVQTVIRHSLCFIYHLH